MLTILLKAVVKKSRLKKGQEKGRITQQQAFLYSLMLLFSKFLSSAHCVPVTR